MIKAYLALGSNLQDPVLQVKRAILELATLPSTRLIKASSLYRNPPVGIVDQPDFINAVVEIETSLSPSELLSALLDLEKRHLRIRREKNGPRTLDLDLLLYGNTIIKNDFLEVPHPRLKERAFVLLPLAEIAPSLVLPCGTAIDTLLTTVKTSDLELLPIGKEY